MKKQKHVDLVLRFTSQTEKDYFIAGLLDGFGERAATYSWNQTGKAKCDAGKAKIINVEPWHEEIYDE